MFGIGLAKGWLANYLKDRLKERSTIAAAINAVLIKMSVTLAPDADTALVNAIIAIGWLGASLLPDGAFSFGRARGEAVK